MTTGRVHLYGKPENSRENSNGTVHPGGNLPQKSNTFRGITFFPFLPKRPKFSVPFLWIPSARLHVQRKRKLILSAVFAKQVCAIFQRNVFSIRD